MNKKILQLSDLEKIISTGKFRRTFQRGRITIIEYSTEQTKLKNELLLQCAVLCNRFRWYRPLRRITLLTKTMDADTAWKRFLELSTNKKIDIKLTNIPIIEDDFDIGRWEDSLPPMLFNYVFLDFNMVPMFTPMFIKLFRLVIFTPKDDPNMNCYCKDPGKVEVVNCPIGNRIWLHAFSHWQYRLEQTNDTRALILRKDWSKENAIKRIRSLQTNYPQKNVVVFAEHYTGTDPKEHQKDMELMQSIAQETKVPITLVQYNNELF